MRTGEFERRWSQVSFGNILRKWLFWTVSVCWNVYLAQHLNLPSASSACKYLPFFYASWLQFNDTVK